MSDTEIQTITTADVGMLSVAATEGPEKLVMAPGGEPEKVDGEIETHTLSINEPPVEPTPLPPPVEPELPPGGHSYRRAEAYEEIPHGDGVMRVEAGHYVVTQADGSVAVHPPEIFAALYPHDA